VTTNAPEGWTRVDTGGPTPFITRQVYRRPDGSTVSTSSRDQRKRHSVLDNGRGSTWWAPGAIGWWIGVLFAIGSLCFALGAAPRYVDAVGDSADAITFFVGSIFFTTAGLLQYLEVANTGRVSAGDARGQRWRLLTWEPHRIDWWAAVVQLAGTLFFNVSTFHAVDLSLSATQVNELVWRPDVAGSICFLIASGLAWAEAGHAWWSWRPTSISWRITALNLGGSIAFGVSAVASKVVPSTEQVRNVTLMNLGTFVGAVCFLVGAVLLLPERTNPEPEDVRERSIVPVGTP
jgi:hypothetical protein